MSEVLSKLREASAENGREVCLIEAAELVISERNSSYGEPEDNFRFIAGLYTVYFREKYGAEFDVDEIDIAILSMLTKVARAGHDPLHLDNYVDGAGYNACAYDIAAERVLAQREQERQRERERINEQRIAAAISVNGGPA